MVRLKTDDFLVVVHAHCHAPDGGRWTKTKAMDPDRTLREAMEWVDQQRANQRIELTISAPVRRPDDDIGDPG